VLRKEQSDLPTQTDPGTPMGRMFRSCRLSALVAEELPEIH
jgi:phthalate 4,5-dioxygenase